MTSTGERLAKLRSEVKEAEQVLSDLQLKQIDLRVEAAVFHTEYERRIWPSQKELESMQGEIEAIQGESTIQGESNRPGMSGLPVDYVPVDEQYRRVWRPSAGDKVVGSVEFKPKMAVNAPGTDSVMLKRLYRKLALQFHPDLAPDAASRERWTDYMRRINAAYANADAGALEGLAGALSSEAPQDAGLTTETALALVPDETEVEQAQSRLQALQLAIASVEAEIFDVEWGWELKLKKDVDAARDRGKDLLAEMVADVKARTEKAKRELELLRGRR